MDSLGLFHFIPKQKDKVTKVAVSWRIPFVHMWSDTHPSRVTYDEFWVRCKQFSRWFNRLYFVLPKFRYASDYPSFFVDHIDSGYFYLPRLREFPSYRTQFTMLKRSCSLPSNAWRSGGQMSHGGAISLGVWGGTLDLCREFPNELEMLLGGFIPSHQYCAFSCIWTWRARQLADWFCASREKFDKILLVCRFCVRGVATISWSDWGASRIWGGAWCA